VEINLDSLSPQAEHARGNAQSLIAARLGGRSTYESEFNSLFGGQRSFGEEAMMNLLYLVDALACIAEILAVAATLNPDEEIEEADADALQLELAEARKDPQQLLLYVDKIIRAALERVSRDDES
jgi:hypothetical protein